MLLVRTFAVDLLGADPKCARGGENMQCRSAAKPSTERKKASVKKYLFILSIIGLQLVNFIVFYVYVNANSIMMAFQWRNPQGETYWTLHAFEFMFSQLTKEGSEMLLALRNTFIYFGLGLILLPVSFTTSYFMYKKIFGYRAFRILFFLPSVLSAVVWSTLYKNIIGVEGPIAEMIQHIYHLPQPPVLFDDSRYALGKTVAPENIEQNVWYTLEIDANVLGALTQSGTDVGLQIAANSETGGTFYLDNVRFVTA